MTRIEFIVRMTEIIMADWRRLMLANPETVNRFHLPGDTVDISWRAMQKAEELAKEYDGRFIDQIEVKVGQ